MYSITAVAKLLGVSRQTIYNKLDTFDKKNLTRFTVKGTKGLSITEEGFEELKSLFNCSDDVKEDVKEESNFDNDSRHVDMLINSLQNENTHLKAVIFDLTRQMENLTKLVENSQILQKQQQDKILLLEESTTAKPFSWVDMFMRKK